jgi:transposase-like protein
MKHTPYQLAAWMTLIAYGRVCSITTHYQGSSAIRDLKQEKLFPEKCERRPSQYVNNIIEQDHRFLKRRIMPGLGFGSYPTAW